MSDLRGVLDREISRIQVSPFTTDRFHRRFRARRRNERIASGAVAVIVAAVAVVVALRAFGSAGRQPANPIVVPRGSIAFVGLGPDWTDPGSLFVFDPATGAVSTLVDLACTEDGSGAMSCPGVRINGVDWSPDGSRIAYSLQQSRGFTGTEPTWTMDASVAGIHVLDLRTGRTTQITPCAPPTCGFQGTLDWSPDGSTIAFTQASGFGDVWLVDADGSHPRRLDTGSLPAQDPAWSPDGRRILFSSGTSLYTIDADKGQPQPVDLASALVPGIGAGLHWPAWSPDGSHIAFVESTRGPNGRLWIAETDGSGARAVTALGSDQEFSAPSWSLDGSTIAVIADGWLETIGADRTELTKLSQAWSQVAPAWYPGS
jgi:dipeptidyl aminopeptidase/acylaminoacyl peptidase